MLDIEQLKVGGFNATPDIVYNDPQSIESKNFCAQWPTAERNQCANIVLLICSQHISQKMWRTKD